MVRALLDAWAQAPDDVRAKGLAWYRGARMMVKAIARKNGVSHAVAAGVVAALSPRLQWAVNVRCADTVLGGGIPRGVFKTSLHKALRITRGGERPSVVLSGPKTRAFYKALMGDDQAAVVDVWVLRAVRWTRKVTDRAYARIAGALRAAADAVGVPTAQLQAVAWVAVRGRAA